MKKISVVCIALLLPVLLWIFSPTLLLTGANSCRVSNTIIEKNRHETIVTTGDWSVTHHLNNNIGFFSGKLNVYNSTNDIIFQENIYRSFSTTSDIVGYQLRSTTISSSKLGKDTLDAEQEKKYLNPVLHTGYVSLTSFFRIPNGIYLFGLPDRPRGMCYR